MKTLKGCFESSSKRIGKTKLGKKKKERKRKNYTVLSANQGK